MSKKTTRAIFSAVIIGGALTMLMWTTVSEGAAYYKHVDEVMTSPEQWYGKNLKLHGFAEQVMVNPGTLEYRFHVRNGAHVVKATYTGLVPDTFQNDAEVVLDGQLGPDGFHATGVTAKCPSKYEATK